MLRLAHLSDLHATPVQLIDPREFTLKRLLGLLSWRRRRRWEHRTHVLEALLDDLGTVAPDHIAVTGDLTNLGLRQEIAAAAVWLDRLGEARRVSVVPGNHDAYARGADPATWSSWRPYMDTEPWPGQELPPEGRRRLTFPTLRVHNDVALVGLCSARPTATFLATGRLGREQLERLEEQLAKLSAAGLFRVLLIHHPPLAVGLSRRRQLTDAAALRAVLGRVGAELVLHGHTHRSTHGEIQGPDGPIPALGVPSSSAVGQRPERRARYHVYRIERTVAGAGTGFRVACSVRAFDATTARFVPAGDLAVQR